MDNQIKQFVTLLANYIHLYVYHAEADLEEGGKLSYRPHIPTTSENLGIFVNPLCVLINCKFCIST